MKSRNVSAVAALFLLSAAWNVRADNPTTPAPAFSAAAPAKEAEAVPKSSIEVMRLVIAKNVQDREAQEEITAAKVDDVVVGWSQIRSGVGDVTVTHRWLHDKEKVADVPLTLKGSPYRTWSRKTLGEPGSWTLQVLNPQG